MLSTPKYEEKPANESLKPFYKHASQYDTAYGELLESGLKKMMQDPRIQKTGAIFLDLGMGKGEHS